MGKKHYRGGGAYSARPHTLEGLTTRVIRSLLLNDLMELEGGNGMINREIQAGILYCCHRATKPRLAATGWARGSCIFNLLVSQNIRRYVVIFPLDLWRFFSGRKRENKNNELVRVRERD